jgi:hypothetical protein
MVDIANDFFFFLIKKKGRREELEWLPYPLYDHSNTLSAKSRGNR